MSPQPGKLRQGALERGKAASWRRKGCCSQREQLSPGEEAWKQALRCLRAFASAVPPSKSALTSSPLSGPKQVSPPQRALLTPSSRLHSLSHAPRGPVLSLHGLIDLTSPKAGLHLGLKPCRRDFISPSVTFHVCSLWSPAQQIQGQEGRLFL